MAQTWLAIKARDGAVIADLPDLSVGTMKHTIGRYETFSATLPIGDKAPPDWQRATLPGASFLILLDDNPSDPTHGIPVGGGLVTRRTRDHTDEISLDAITGAGYFDRRFTRDETFTQVGQNAIIEYYVENYIVDGAGGKNGIPIRVENLDGGPGTLRDRTYLDRDDKTVYGIFTDLMGVEGGPEWSDGWEWTDPTHLGMVLYVGQRIGQAVQS